MFKKWGWHPDLPDFRDFRLARVAAPITTPDVVDLRPKMPVVYDQGDLGSCHDEVTEILTSEGWVKFSNLSLDHKVASVDPATHKLIFEYPSRIIKLPYSGVMLVGKHQALDFKVTTDHKMLLRKWNEQKRTLDDEFQFIAAKDIGWYAGFLGSVNYEGECKLDTFVLPGVEHKQKPQRKDKVVNMDVWLMFLGIYLAEGTMIKQDQWSQYKIQIAGSKEREKQFIRFVLDSMGQHYLELSDRFTFESKQVYSILTSLGLRGVKAPDKFVPEFVFKLSGEQMKSLLLGHYMGDGSEQNGLKTHYTSSKRLADDIQRLLFLSGQLTGRSERSPRLNVMLDGRIAIGRYPEYAVRAWQSDKISIDRSAHISKEFYNGFVYCAEVPTYHTLVTRRNGKILISGNCTGNSSAAAFEYDLIRQGLPSWTPSRLGIYYDERVLEGTVSTDAGAQIRDAVKVLATNGAAPETLWPYVPANFAMSPPAVYVKTAAQDLALQYARVDQSQLGIEGCLSKGYPVIFGFTVYSSFESEAVARTGVMPMPSSKEKCLGGHAVLCVGYERSKRMFIIRNSWGVGWGDKGYFYMPYNYLLNANLADDLWALYTVEEAGKQA